MKILFQGNGSLRLTTNEGIVIYIDPYAGKGYDVPADMILVTHQHSDHNKIDKPAKKEECFIYQNFDALVDGEYKTITHRGITIEAVPAYNKNHKREECVGFVVTVDDRKFYFAGDTSKIPEMSNLTEKKIDYAFLPTDGIYNMGVAEAVECANIIKPRFCTPIHMSALKLFSKKKAKSFDYEGKLILELDNEAEIF